MYCLGKNKKAAILVSTIIFCSSGLLLLKFISTNFRKLIIRIKMFNIACVSCFCATKKCCYYLNKVDKLNEILTTVYDIYKQLIVISIIPTVRKFLKSLKKFMLLINYMQKALLKWMVVYSNFVFFNLLYKNLKANDFIKNKIFPTKIKVPLKDYYSKENFLLCPKCGLYIPDDDFDRKFCFKLKLMHGFFVTNVYITSKPKKLNYRWVVWPKED